MSLLSRTRGEGIRIVLSVAVLAAGCLPILAGASAPAAAAGSPAGEPPHGTLPVLVPKPAVQALQAIGWAPEDLHFDRTDVGLWGGDRYRLPLYDSWIDRPFLIPGDVEFFQRTLLDAVQKPSDLATFAGARLGRGVRRGLLGDPAQAWADSLQVRDPLLRALGEVWKAGGSILAGAAERQAWEAAAAIPESWRRPLAVILKGEAEAARWRAMAFSSVRSPDPEADPIRWLYRESIHYVVGLDSDTQDLAWQRGVEEAAAGVDLSLLQAGASDLLLALQKVLPELETIAGDGTMAPPESREPAGEGGRKSGGMLRLQTPLGLVAIGTPGRDHYPQADYLLILDPGGNDRYEGGAAGTPGSPVSVLMDLSGQDNYATADSTRPAFGAGVTGIGILLDLVGDDRYGAVHLSQGAGLCGFGLLSDRDGDDLYDAVTASQGAGLFGIGILADGGGTDRYHAFQQSQGFGYTLGAGLLVDAAGNDEYTADDTRIRFPSAQSKDHNSSLSQGFGFGKRADFSDGHSLAGGFGMLLDGAGDDRYRCGVFGQGAGYWYGTGVLADAGGDDSFEGVWYTQGSAAHFALGVLWDGGGDDQYASTMNMAQGAGHDFSLGLLYDRSGRDRYRAPNLSLGGGNANGFGIFWDVAGDDQYEVDAATTLGRSNIGSRGGLRDRMKSLGLFMDTGGHDTYPATKGFAGNDRTWTQVGSNLESPLATEAGVGLDTEWGPADK